ncbi:MAG: hypothetical protein Q8919_07585 [Bacteroidota bacterium]|nr:hypothetical protein [Bacteroidota bacterium]
MTSRRSILLGLVLGAFLGVFGFSAVYAQVPRSISYQGLLVKNNQPVNGTVNIDVKIYDAAGSVLYQETEPPVVVTNGIFNIQLGGVSGTLPSSLKFDEQYYLGIDVDKTGELPHTPFVAAPYALNAQTVGGIGVSVTPQPGMLLPLDQNGKIPKAVLPASSASLTTINNDPGDGSGNITLQNGPGISILDNVGTHTITISANGAGGLFPDKTYLGHFRAGNGLQVLNSPVDTSITYLIAPNGISNTMLGTGVVSGMKLDQNVPQLGMFQDALGNLNVGVNPSLTYYAVGTSPTSGNVPPRNIGLNLSNPNVWLALQTFNAGITVNGTTNLNGPVNITPGPLTINGTPEPNVPSAASVVNYEFIDNGDMRIVGATNLIGNTFLNQTFTSAGNSTVGTNASAVNTLGSGASSNNTIGAAGSSTNTMQGSTNNLTGGINNLTGTTNNVNATTNNMGTVAGQTNNIGTGGSSANTMGAAGSGSNTLVGLTNNVNATTNNIGTTGVTTTNNVGTLGTTANNVNGTTNTMTGSVTNSIQAPTNNIGTTNAVSQNTVGNAGTSTNTLQGLANNLTATTNNVGATTATTNINIGNTLPSTTNFFGNVIHNGLGEPNAASAGAVTNYELRNLGDFQNSGATNLIGNVFMNQTLTVGGLATMNGGLTVVGPLTQSGGNATINGGANNVFGSVAGSANAIGAAGSTNTYTGQNNFNGNINQTAGTTTLLNTTTGNLQVNGTLGSTLNISLGTLSTNNGIGNAGAINTVTGATNNLTGGTNNLTGIVNNVNASTNNIGINSGNVNNIGTVSGGGISTNNIGNLNAGTNNNINGLTTVQFTGDQTYLRIAGGAASCAAAFPTSAQSELLVNGDGWFDGTIAACRLNIFGINPSCITNLATTNFSSCAGGATPINLVSSINGVPTGVGATNLTNMQNIQAQNTVQTNTTLIIGTTGTNATNITSSNPGPASINQQTPSVSGRIPTFQQYQLPLVPASGPNGGGSVTFTTVNAPGLNFDANSGIMVSYRTHNVGFPTGQLWITQTLTTVTVESSAAGDNNTVQITILRP